MTSRTPDLPPGEDDAVGYGRPPRAGRFRPGQSGNPHGRPRRPQDARRDRGASVRRDGRSEGKRPAEANDQARGHGEAAGQQIGERRSARGAIHPACPSFRSGRRRSVRFRAPQPGRRSGRRGPRPPPVAVEMTAARLAPAALHRRLPAPFTARTAAGPPDGTPASAARKTDVKALLREDFFAFLVRCFAELHGGQELSPAWHAEVLAAKLAGRGARARVKRLVVNVPPRHLKSLAASVALPAWLLGHDPAARHRQRHLRTGPVRQVRPRLPGGDDLGLVPGAVPDARLASPRPPLPGARDDAAAASAWRPRSAAC